MRQLIFTILLVIVFQVTSCTCASSDSSSRAYMQDGSNVEWTADAMVQDSGLKLDSRIATPDGQSETDEPTHLDVNAFIDATDESRTGDESERVDAIVFADSGDAASETDQAASCEFEVPLANTGCIDGTCALHATGEVKCRGSGSLHSAIAIGSKVYFGFIGSQHGNEPNQTVAPLIVTIDTNQQRNSVRTLDQISLANVRLRVGPGGRPVLTVAYDDRVVLYNLLEDDAAPVDKTEVMTTVGRPIEALYDGTGALHIFSVVTDVDTNTDSYPYYHAIGGAQENDLMFDAAAFGSQVVVLLDGTVGFVSWIRQDGEYRLIIWTQAQGARELFGMVIGPNNISGPDGRFSVVPSDNSSGVFATWIDNDTILTQTFDFNAAPVASWPRIETPVCNGSMGQVSYPAICPHERGESDAGEQLIKQGLGRDANDRPWLVALTEDTTAICEWYEATPCFEYRTCSCEQRLSIVFRSSFLHIRELQGQNRNYTVELGRYVPRSLFVTDNGAGTIVAAVQWDQEENDELWTHIRYFVLE